VTIRLTSFVLGIILAGAACAQAQDYSAGKSPAQLFASDCSGCHKSPQGLAKTADTASLATFLREHYTTKKETAGALAAFVVGAGVGSGAAPAAAKPSGRGRTAAPAAAPVVEPAPAAEEPSPARSSMPSFPRIFPWQSARPSDDKPDAKPEAKPDVKPEAASEAEPAAKPSNRRRTAAPADAKEAEPSTPAIVRHQGGSRPAVRRAAPAEAAKPAEGNRPAEGNKPAETAKPAEATKPVEAAKPAEASPATTPSRVPEDKLKSYLGSGETAKPAAAGSKPPDAAASRLNDYATSGDTAASKGAVSGADKPASDKSGAPNGGGEAKPSSVDKPAAAQ
jgi:hypothetical protein